MLHAHVHTWITMRGLPYYVETKSDRRYFFGQSGRQRRHEVGPLGETPKECPFYADIDEGRLKLSDSVRLTNQSAVRWVVGWMTWMSSWEKPNNSSPAARLFSHSPSTKDGAGHFVSNIGVPLHLPLSSGIGLSFLTSEVSPQRGRGGVRRY